MTRAFFYRVALVLVAGSARADVLVVDAAGGGDHQNLQEAVDAASNGDTLLVRSGTYAAPSVQHKGVQIVADDGAVVVVEGKTRIQNTLVEHEVALVGLELRGVVGAAYALVLEEVRGGIRLQRCSLRGADGHNGDVPFDDAADALVGVDVLDLALVDCMLRGGDGQRNSLGGSDGGDGLDLLRVRVALYDTTVRGGDGGDKGWASGDLPGYGGHGIRAQDGVLFASGSAITGGDGGDGVFCPFGGNGLYLVGSTMEAWLLDDLVSGGLDSCGNPEAPIVTQGGATASVVPGSARSFLAPAPVGESTTVDLEFRGEPGDAVFLLVSDGTAYELELSLHGVRLVSLPLVMGRRFLGTIPPGGTLTKRVSTPALPAGTDDLHLRLQALFSDTQNDSWLASPATLVVLDASL